MFDSISVGCVFLPLLNLWFIIQYLLQRVTVGMGDRSIDNYNNGHLNFIGLQEIVKLCTDQ